MPTHIFHITHVNNLAEVIRSGGLWCDAERIRQGVECVGIAHQRIKERRAVKLVRDRKGRVVGAGGVLADYVPFYFANRSPMLYAIHTGHVEGYDGGQRQVVHLATTVERVIAKGCQWCFTDGHAVLEMTEFFDDTECLNRIDWEVIRHSSWANRLGDPDRKRRKQAEFLVHGSVPWDWIGWIGVMDRDLAERVEEIIAKAEHRPAVIVRRHWYY